MSALYKKLNTSVSSQFCLSHPSPLIITNLLCVSTDLPMPTILYKWNPQTYGLLCLASSSQHNVFKVHLHCIITSFLPMDEDYSSVWIYHICLSIGQLGCFHSLAIYEQHCCEHSYPNFCLNICLNSFEYTPKSRMVGSCGKSMFDYRKNCQVFYKVDAPFYFPTSSIWGSSFSPGWILVIVCVLQPSALVQSAITKTGRPGILNNKHLFLVSLVAAKSKIRVLIDSGSGASSLSSLQVAVFLMFPCMEKRETISTMSLLVRTLIPLPSTLMINLIAFKSPTS